MRIHPAIVATTAFLGLATSASHAVTVHDESLDGDLSGVFASPTPLLFIDGANTLIGTTGDNGGTGATDGTDADYFEFTLGPGQSLDSIIVDSYAALGSGNGSFMGYRATPFTDQTSVDGWTLFSSFTNDILPNLGVTIEDGTHHFWVQETAPATVEYQFTFNVVPEPGSLALLAFGGLALARRRR